MLRRIRYKSAAKRSKSATFTSDAPLASSSHAGGGTSNTVDDNGSSSFKRAPLKKGSTGEDAQSSPSTVSAAASTNTNAATVASSGATPANSMALTLLSVPIQVTTPLLRQLCEVYGPLKSLTVDIPQNEAASGASGAASPSCYRAVVVYLLENSRQNAITALNGSKICGSIVRALPGTKERLGVGGASGGSLRGMTGGSGSGMAGSSGTRGSSSTRQQQLQQQQQQLQPQHHHHQPNPSQLFKQPPSERPKSLPRLHDQGSQRSESPNVKGNPASGPLGRSGSDALSSSSYNAQHGRLGGGPSLGSSIRKGRSKKNSKSSSTMRRRHRS